MCAFQPTDLSTSFLHAGSSTFDSNAQAVTIEQLHLTSCDVDLELLLKGMRLFFPDLSRLCPVFLFHLRCLDCVAAID